MDGVPDSRMPQNVDAHNKVEDAVSEGSATQPEMIKNNGILMERETNCNMIQISPQ
jgi:hypothetical protein